MRVETIELLRCPRSHETTPLVAVAHRRDGERLLEATLGCPVCGAEYALRDGDLYLSTIPTVSHTAAPVDLDRTAALLNVSEPGMRVMLCGDYADVAWLFADAVNAKVLAVNVSARDALARVHNESAQTPDMLHCETQGAIPLADAALHAIAVDQTHASWLIDATRVVRPGGRILAHANAPVPNGCRELARDANEWVAVVETVASSPVALRRRDSTSS